jgi:integral membrane protein
MDTASTLQALDRIRMIAIADGIALVALLICTFTDQEGIINILGPVHGIGFVALLYLCAKGAGEQRWGWWFPAIVLVTAGPLGSLIGDAKIRRELAAAPATA